MADLPAKAFCDVLLTEAGRAGELYRSPIGASGRAIARSEFFQGELACLDNKKPGAS